MLHDILFGLLAVIVGIGASFGIYWLLDRLVNLLPNRTQKRVRAYAYILPAGVLLVTVLLLPLIQTVIFSFYNSNSRVFVGFENYIDLFTDQRFLGILLNNFLWVAFVPAATVAVGLLVASLTNQVGPTREKIFKSLIFMPMAISFVSAATIWSFLYVNVPPGRPQIGLLNALVVVFGGEPQPWMLISDWRLNSFLLMIIIVWLQAGFAMVLLSAAIKAVPEETVEAARVDGANRIQLFWQIVLPQIWGTVVAVFITVLILVMKIFDIVLAMTGGAFQTSVLGYEFYQEYFVNSEAGRGSAIVVVLVLLIVPLMWLQIRTARRQETLR
jgi:alpha-glucoside transport system permease protein